MNYSMSDIYGNYPGFDTTEKTIPEEKDQEVLNEDIDHSKPVKSNNKKVFLSIGLILVLIVVLGGRK